MCFRMPRVLGIDYGARRIGLAVSDADGQLAFPLEVLENPGGQAVFERIGTVCEEKGVERIVVGLPVNMNGSRGEAAEQARDFARRLEAATGIPVDTWDERLSSREAERVLIESGASRRRRRKVIDKMAARLILQAYLDRAALGGQQGTRG